MNHDVNIEIIGSFRTRQWPAEWGDDLQVLLYGDFKAPEETIEFPELQITLHAGQAGQAERALIRTAYSVFKATVRVPDRTPESLLDATRRVNILIGTLSVRNSGLSAIGWYSAVTHGAGAFVLSRIEPIKWTTAVSSLLNLPAEVRCRVEAALYFVREPRQLMGESHRSYCLRIFASYWNAFECLVEAVLLLRPMPKQSKQEKQAQIDAFVAARNGAWKAADIEECYRIVSPGFVTKASHVLRECFGDEAATHIDECFRRNDRCNRLYDIRNAINHGDIDADNRAEILRVESRLGSLCQIIFGLFETLGDFTNALDHCRFRRIVIPLHFPRSVHFTRRGRLGGG